VCEREGGRERQTEEREREKEGRKRRGFYSNENVLKANAAGKETHVTM
jgi:hypothetical protein